MSFTAVAGFGAVVCLVLATIFDNAGLAGFGIALTIYGVQAGGS